MDRKGYSLSSAHHEETHAFTSSAHYDMLGKHTGTSRGTVYFEIPSGNYSSFYLKGWGTHHVKRGPLFDSIKITKLLPAKKYKGLRYDTYIIGSKYSSSRQFGIYGLLNEYHAYFHGNFLALNMEKAGVYKNHSNDYTAYAEFTLFILKYLELAKKEYPRVYEATMNNKLLMETFVRIHDEFEPIFSQRAASLNKRDKTISNYKNIGVVAYKSKSANLKLTMFQTTGTNKVYYNNAKEYAPYLEELQTPKMKKLMKEVRRAANAD